MGMVARYLLLAVALATHTNVHAQSMLRVTCDGDDVGAEVSVNGKVKGACPVDMLVEPGTLKLRVVKKVDALRERVFEQELPIGEGVRKKVEARLNAPVFNAEGQRQEAIRLKAYADMAPVREEDGQWNQALDKATQTAMQAYLEKYPNGRYVAQARQNIEEYRRPPPPRPQMPVTVSEDIWRTLESSATYRNSPRQRVIKSNSNESTLFEYNAKALSSNPIQTTNEKTTTIQPLGDHCATHKTIRKTEQGGRTRVAEVDSYTCGDIPLGSVSGGKSILIIKRLDELKGSLFPMRIGARQSVRYQTAYGADTKYDSTTAWSCEVVSQRPALELNSRLAGIAWKVHCQGSSTQDNKTNAYESDDYYLEELGVRLSAIGVFASKEGAFVLPKPGFKNIYSSGNGENGTRSTTTYNSYEWTVGE